MNFSWKALILAPLPIPFLFCALLTVSSPGKDPFMGFLCLFAIACVLSYGITICLFLPCFFVISRFMQMTASLTGLLGASVGVLLYVPYIWMSYCASGPDSGPPESTFAEFLRRSGFSYEFWGLVAAGLITALVYWFLANKLPRKSAQLAA